MFDLASEHFEAETLETATPFQNCGGDGPDGSDVNTSRDCVDAFTAHASRDQITEDLMEDVPPSLETLCRHVTDEERPFSGSSSHMPTGFDHPSYENMSQLNQTTSKYPSSDAWMFCGSSPPMTWSDSMFCCYVPAVAPAFPPPANIVVALACRGQTGELKSLQQWVAKGVTSIRWTVDGKKLRGSDKVAVSPRFDISLGGATIPFKLSLLPLTSGTGKGGGSFKGSQGHGKMQLKCEGEIQYEGTLAFELSLPEVSIPATAMLHDFGQNGICTCQRIWDFKPGVNKTAHTFSVALDISSE